MQHSPRRMAQGGRVADFGDDKVKDPMARRETLELVRAYYTIERPVVRKRVSDMVKSIAVSLVGE